MQLKCDCNSNSHLDHYFFIDIHKLVLIPARKLTVLVSMLARYFGTGQLKQLGIEPNINFHSIHFVDIFGHVNKEN